MLSERENFSRKLDYEEGVEIPLEKLLTVGQTNLEDDCQAFVETARKIDPSKPPADVMKTLEDDHPDGGYPDPWGSTDTGKAFASFC